MSDQRGPFDFVRDAGLIGIGLYREAEESLRWQAARLLIRWNELVLKGEDDESPAALQLKKSMDEFFDRLRERRAELAGAASQTQSKDASKSASPTPPEGAA